MEPRLEKIVKAFESKGWTLVGSVDVSSDWWFQDIIQLVSTWTPVGATIYLTLLTDPQVTDGKIVWSIAISSTVPESRIFTWIEQITLNDIKRTNLELLVDNINKEILNEWSF